MNPEEKNDAEAGAKETRHSGKIIMTGAGAGIAAVSGVFAAAWGMSRDGKVNPEVLETEQKENLTIERDESGQIQAILIDQDKDGRNDVMFANPQKMSAEGSNKPDTDSKLAVAASVRDDMSFSDAFTAARQEVGSGGVFVWHGKLYGTYYQDEWDNMTHEQKTAYHQEVNQYIAEYSMTDEHTAANQKQDVITDELYVTASVETVSDNGGQQDAVILGEADLNEDGIIDAALADTNNDDIPDAILIDSNQDGIADAVVVDHDYDGVMDVIYADQDQDGSPDFVTDMQGNPMSPETDTTFTSDNSEDFDNNADVSDWV